MWVWAGVAASRLRYSGPTSPPALYSVYRTSATGPAKLVDRFAGVRGSNTARWNGTDRRGRRVPPGTYAFAVTVQNKGLVVGLRARAAAADGRRSGAGHRA